MVLPPSYPSPAQGSQGEVWFRHDTDSRACRPLPPGALHNNSKLSVKLMVLYRQRFNKWVQNRLFVQSPHRERAGVRGLMRCGPPALTLTLSQRERGRKTSPCEPAQGKG